MIEKRVIIAGSRNITNYKFIKINMDYLFPVIGGLEVVSGTAKGVDTLGEKWAKDRKSLPIKRFPADWDKHGKSAGYLRNAEMAEYADVLVAFWDGESKGTKHMINLALKYNLEIHIFNSKTDQYYG